MVGVNNVIDFCFPFFYQKGSVVIQKDQDLYICFEFFGKSWW